jgi:acylphosphatase
MIKNLKIKIFGDVMGVGFRDAAYWKARKLYIAGFVMNEPDGTVYIEAEGDQEGLAALKGRPCQRGNPSGSRTWVNHSRPFKFLNP